MGVTSIELISKRRSTLTPTAKKHRVSYRVICDDKTDGTVAASSATVGMVSIPVIGQEYPDPDGTHVTNVEANPDGDSMYAFIVDVDYTDEAGGIGDAIVSPLDRPVEIDYDAEEFTEEYFIDHSTTPKPVTTSAGEPFENNRTRDTSRTVIVITRNEESHDPVTAEGFKETLNSDSVTIDGATYTAGMLKLSPIKARKTTESYAGSSITYYRKTYTLKLNVNTWDDVALDAGFHELNGGHFVSIVGDEGSRVTKPWPLDGSGAKKANSTDAPATLTFKPYARVAFSSLDFPT